MRMIRALTSNDWSVFEESANEPLGPLQLSKMEENVVIARMKKLAKDAAFKFSNALELVHKSYEEQDWERQSEYGDFVRPSPSNKEAWKQYEKFIELAVQLLSKYRGVKGDWRTDKFVAIPTNDRSSMGSMAAAEISESVVLVWEENRQKSTVTESIDSVDSLLLQNCIIGDTTLEEAYSIVQQHLEPNIVVLGEASDSHQRVYVYDIGAELLGTADLILRTC